MMSAPWSKPESKDGRWRRRRGAGHDVRLRSAPPAFTTAATRGIAAKPSLSDIWSMCVRGGT